MNKEDTCWECGAKLAKENVEYSLYGVSLGKFLAQVCKKCNESYFDEATSRKITTIAKGKGLWGLRSATKIGQAGSTLDIRLSKKIIEFMDLKKGEEVIIYPESKKKLTVTV